MLGTEVTTPSPIAKRRRKSPRADLRPHEFEELFILLTTLGAATARVQTTRCLQRVSCVNSPKRW